MSQGWTTHTRCEEGSSLILGTVPFAAGTARPPGRSAFSNVVIVRLGPRPGIGQCPLWVESRPKALTSGMGGKRTWPVCD
jgi:hypothetical protein